MSKSFKENALNALENPAMQFITTAEAAGPERESLAAPTVSKENKSRRVQLLLKPSVYEAVKERARRSGTSVNDWVNGVLERAVGTGEALTLEELLQKLQNGNK